MTKDKNFDLSSLSTSALSNDGAEVEILTLDGDPTGVKFTVAGTDSNIYKTEQRKIQQKLLKTMMGKKKDIDLSATDEDALHVLAKCTLSWENVVYNGKELECNYNNAKMIYTEVDVIREQVSTFINDRANFIKG